VYERFLGKVIRLTSGGRAKVEEKPEVRKAGGVYYTPKYIVDYIVENTVGKLLENKNPKQVEKLRILDPACGSGSFLIGAYEYLLNWHRDWYVANDPEKHKKAIYQGMGGLWYLTTTEKKKILLNNIYGVDIDPQAVEVTKLNLLLKALEGENEQTLESQLIMFRERALPDIRSNIKCGNSLIGPDYYDNTQLDLLDDGDRYRINAFDWEEEFGEIMKSGGFDAVIGNPPYVRVHRIDKEHFEYYKNNYDVIGQTDLYVLFIERAIHYLCEGGFFSYITPKFLYFNLDSENTRILLLSFSLLKLADVGQAFNGVNTECVVTVIKKSEIVNNYIDVEILNDRGILVWYNRINQRTFKYYPNKIFNIYLTEDDINVIKKVIDNSKIFTEYFDVKRGMEIGKKALREAKRGIPVLLGQDTGRYYINHNNTFVKKSEDEVRRLKSYSEVDKKILIRRVGARLMCTLDCNRYYFSKNLYSCINKSDLDDKYFLGILNSILMNFFFKKYFTTKKKDIFPEFQKYQIDNLPIRIVSLNNGKDSEIYKLIIFNVSNLLDLHKRLPFAKSTHEKTTIQRQIDATDKQIDALVYELYGLTEKEIGVIERKD
jgi:adenine-specific DNA-methyltransferase